VLFELLGWITTAAKGVVTTAEEKIADAKSTMPVGTTQALIEQGAAVFSSIHARLHESQARVLKILCRLNRWHFNEMRKSDVVADLEITREDFQKNTDVIPVSDPHIFSETQRMAQMQAVLSLADKHPNEFNMNKVLARSMKQMKIPNINELLKDVPAPEQRTSADENAAMLIGQPAYAYMQQDHIAHIQDHLQFGMNPFLGQSPFADPNYLNNLIEHTKQHMTLWYLNRSNAYVAQARGGKPVDNYNDPLLTGTIDQLYTAVGAHISLDTKEVFEQFAPAFQQLIQMAQKRQQSQKQALPPDAQVVKDTSMAETQRKALDDKARLQFDDKKLEADTLKHLDDNRTKIAIENAKLTNQVIQEVAPQQLPPPAPMMGAEPPAMMPPQGMPTGMPQLQGEPNGNV
jgi:hypothetical protein